MLSSESSPTSTNINQRQEDCTKSQGRPLLPSAFKKLNFHLLYTLWNAGTEFVLKKDVDVQTVLRKVGCKKDSNQTIRKFYTN